VHKAGSINKDATPVVFLPYEGYVFFNWGGVIFLVILGMFRMYISNVYLIFVTMFQFEPPLPSTNPAVSSWVSFVHLEAFRRLLGGSSHLVSSLRGIVSLPNGLNAF